MPIIGAENVLKRIACVLGAGHLDTLKRHATAKPMDQLEVESLGVEGVVALVVLEGVEEGVIPDMVRVRRRKRNRGMLRCWLEK